MRPGKGKHTIVLSFATAEALVHFASVALDPALVVYAADVLDREFSGNPGRNSWVVRRKGDKPDDMALDLD
jgi:hypothetical protein